MTLFSPLQNQRGVTLMVVLVMMVILGLSAGIAGSTWSSVMQKEREEQLLWAGDQYRRAIESYVNFRNQPGSPGAVGGVGTKLSPIPLYPNSLEDLLRDSRATQVVRHLRRLYKDPFTGEDFELVKDQGGRIKGVRSASKEEPFKKDNFDEIYKDFRNAESYQKWEFTYEPSQKKTSSSGTPRTPAKPVFPQPPSSN